MKNQQREVREQHCVDEYCRAVGIKMWKQMNQRVVAGAREVYGSILVGRKDQRSERWNDLTEGAVERKETA